MIELYFFLFPNTVTTLITLLQHLDDTEPSCTNPQWKWSWTALVARILTSLLSQPWSIVTVLCILI